MRNKFFKNCSSPKTFTYLKRSNSQLVILEGLFDLLSLFELQKNIASNSDIIVLNAISFVKDIGKYISNYKQAVCCRNSSGWQYIVSLDGGQSSSKAAR